MKKEDNERLCALAQKGDTEARDLLLKNNLGFIRKTANEIYLKSNLAESDLSTGTSDLEQEGCLGLLTAAQRRVTGGVLGPITSHLTWSLGMLFLLPHVLTLGV